MSLTDLTSILGSDTLLGCLFLFAIALASCKLLPVKLNGDDGAVGVVAAVTAYKSYEKASRHSARKMRAAFHAGLRTAAGNTKRIANEIGYSDKLEKLERAIEVNAVVSNGIYKLATTTDGANANGGDAGLYPVIEDARMEGHAKVREALKHFVRDWSEEGRRERCQAFGVVLDALKRLEREVGGRRGKRVLVPGAGLGRLAWEISQLGLFAHRLSALGWGVDLSL